MFPNLRLMLSASLATLILVAIVGSGLSLFRPPPTAMADVSDAVRTGPVGEARNHFRADTISRRNSELHRLLALPDSPVRAYAPEPPLAFPYALQPADSNVATTATVSSDLSAAASPAVSETAPQAQSARANAPGRSRR